MNGNKTLTPALQFWDVTRPPYLACLSKPDSPLVPRCSKHLPLSKKYLFTRTRLSYLLSFLPNMSATHSAYNTVPPTPLAVGASLLSHDAPHDSIDPDEDDAIAAQLLHTSGIDM